MASQIDLQGFSSTRKTEDLLIKPAFTSVAGGVMSKFIFFPSKSEFDVMGKKLGFNTAIMIALYIGSLIGTMATDFVIPVVAREDQIRRPVSAAVNLAVDAGATIGSAALLNSKAPGELGFVKLGGLGMLAEVLGSYAYYEFFAPMAYRQ
jgi:hypothetical protein